MCLHDDTAEHGRASRRSESGALRDMNARSTGNDITSAHKIAYRIFAKIEQIQILKVRVDRVGDHRVAGLRLSGVKFHGVVTRAMLLEETQRLALDAISAAPVEECDIEVLVPLSVGHTPVATNDSGMPPTERTVFSLTVRRGESSSALARRVARGQGVYFDPEFAQSLSGATISGSIKTSNGTPAFGSITAAGRPRGSA